MKASDEIQRLQSQISHGRLSRDEPLFVLRARDWLAADIVRHWIEAARRANVPEGELREAEELVQAMEKWHERQVPGRPETRRRIEPLGPPTNAQGRDPRDAPPPVSSALVRYRQALRESREARDRVDQARADLEKIALHEVGALIPTAERDPVYVLCGTDLLIFEPSDERPKFKLQPTKNVL